MKNILVVEDERMIRQGIKTMISKMGFVKGEIFEANNGVEALKILQDKDIDVMFTDIKMPKMDGIELIEKIQEFCKKPLIVIVSGFDDFNYAIKAIKGGVKEYLLKPIERESLKDILIKFENELEKKENFEEKIEKIAIKEIKQILLEEDISYENKENLLEISKFKKILAKYVVCALPNNSNFDISNYKQDTILLNNIENNQILIIREHLYEEFLASQESFIGISTVKQGVDEIFEGNKEAILARYEAFFANLPIILYGTNTTINIPHEIHNYNFNIELMDKICQMIGTNKAEDTFRIIEIMCNDTIMKLISYKDFENNTIYLIENISKLYCKVLKLDEKKAVQLLNLLSYPSIKDYMAELKSWVETLNNNISSQFDEYRNKSKIQESIRYIRENFDKDLNMALVSNIVSMNYSLFSRLFKQYTGTNFVFYLRNLRINEAKKLLENSELKINEISKKVGYENEKHFMKTFKTVSGVSPSEYRKNIFMKKE